MTIGTRWEYKVLFISDEMTDAGPRLSLSEAEKGYVRLEELGEQGWELLAIHKGFHREYAILKRPDPRQKAFEIHLDSEGLSEKQQYQVKQIARMVVADSFR